MKAKDLINENVGELEAKLETLRHEIYELRSELLDSKTQKTHLIGEKRKDIARILTILGQRSAS